MKKRKIILLVLTAIGLVGGTIALTPLKKITVSESKQKDQTYRDPIYDSFGIKPVQMQLMDYSDYTQKATDDTNYSTQKTYHLDSLNLKDTWSKYRGDGVTIAVVDTGINYNHEDFVYYNQTGTSISSLSAEFIDTNASGTVTTKTVSSYGWSVMADENGHGTNVASTIASRINGKYGVGVAPNVNLLFCKCPNLLTSEVSAAIKYAADNDADIITMSLGLYSKSFISPYTGKTVSYSTSASSLFSTAINYAHNKGCLILASAGNDNTSNPSFPASNNYVIGVGALEKNSRSAKAGYSNYNDSSAIKNDNNNVDVTCVGSVYVASNDSTTSMKETAGTSFSCPITAAALALYCQKHTDWTVESATKALFNSCSDIGSTNWDTTFGYGCLDIDSLINYSESSNQGVQMPSDYYSSIANNLSGNDLLNALSILNLQKRTSTVGYSSMGTSSSGKFKYTDYDPTTVQYDSNNQPYGTKILSFYSGQSVTSFNREHVWPNSRGGGSGGSAGSPYVDEDIYMPRPTIQAENSNRGNSKYVEGLCHSSNGWDPVTAFEDNIGVYEGIRGECARIIFYCMTVNSKLVLDDTATGGTTGVTMGKLSDLLKWNLEYPVNDREIRRQSGGQYLQGNRNAFVDQPDYACKIWGNTNEATKQICSAGSKTLSSLSVTGTPSKTSYEAGETFDSAGLTVTATYDDSTSEDITESVVWTPNPLTVGTTEVIGTYTKGAVSKTVTISGITVVEPSNPIAVTGVTLNKSTLTLTTGKSETLVATISPNNAYNKKVKWSSNNTTVATVTQIGEITAKSSGSAVITVTTDDGNMTASCNVTVTDVETSVKITRLSCSGTNSYNWHNWSQSGISGQLYYYPGENSKIQMNGSKTGKSIFSNTDNGLNIDSITIKSFSGTPSFTVYGSNTAYTASSVTNGTNIGTKNSSTSGVTWSFGNNDFKYFSIVLGGSSVAYISEIEVSFKVESPKEITSISAEIDSDYDIYVGDTLDLSKIIVTGTDGTNDYTIDDFTVEGFDSNAAGINTITIKYVSGTNILTTTLQLTILENSLSSIDVLISKTYKPGDQFSYDDLVVTGNYAKDSKAIDDFECSLSSGYIFKYEDCGKKTITISVGNVLNSTDLTIIRNVYSAPTNTSTTFSGSSFSSLGGTVTSGDVTVNGVTFSYTNCYYYSSQLSFNKTNSSNKGSMVNKTPFTQPIKSVTFATGGSNTNYINKAISKDGINWVDYSSSTLELGSYYYLKLYVTGAVATSSDNAIQTQATNTYINLKGFTVDFYGVETAKTLTDFIMNSDTVGQCVTQFELARSKYLNMLDAEKSIFETSTEYTISTARSRYEAWAKALNMNAYSEGSMSNRFYLSSLLENNKKIVVIITSIITSTTLLGLCFIKRKKYN